VAAGSDVLILDAAQTLSQHRHEFNETRLRELVSQAGRGGAEVFVRINEATLAADLEASVCPGLTGIVLANIEQPEPVREVSECLAVLERRRGIASGSLQIDVEIGTAMGVWNSLEIARADSRLSALTVGETSLHHSLHLDPEANLEQDPLELIKFQIITNAVAAGIQAQGMSYPLSITMEEAEEVRLVPAVRKARDMGFKGAVCPHPSWVGVCNRGFRPSEEELAYYRKVREVFAEGLRRGLASVPLDGRMVDVPVDLRARVFLEWGERCARRDAAKAVVRGG
jgi:citrate lyase subunit beta/citryl-CoA lyase